MRFQVVCLSIPSVLTLCLKDRQMGDDIIYPELLLMVGVIHWNKLPKCGQLKDKKNSPLRINDYLLKHNGVTIIYSIYIVKWSPTERREIGNFPYPSVFELTGLKDWPLKGGIRNVGQLLGLPVEGSKECRSSYLYFVTSPGWIEKGDRGPYSSPNESPDRVRKEKEAEWLARTLKTEVAFFVSGNRNKEFSFQDGGHRGRTCKSHAETPGEETEIEFLDRR